MGPKRFGPILLFAAALAACGPVPTQRQTISTGALTPAASADSVRVSPGTAPATLQTATVQTGSLRAGGLRSGPMPASAPSSPTGAELAAVTDILTGLQTASFAANAEHCGYVGRDAAGRIISSPVNRGTEASCEMPAIPPGMTLLASFHTHSTYSPYYASEWPTVADVMSDAALGIDGYISTPGGRLWYIDTEAMTVRELCGRGCLPQDPDYRARDDGPLSPLMTVSDLQRWERG